MDSVYPERTSAKRTYLAGRTSAHLLQTQILIQNFLSRSAHCSLAVQETAPPAHFFPAEQAEPTGFPEAPQEEAHDAAAGSAAPEFAAAPASEQQQQQQVRNFRTA